MSINQFSIKDVPLNDDSTFNTICDGRTFGVFQLESYLGKAWAKKTMPRNIEEIADLISLIRPGCLDSGMAEEYVQVKIEGREPFYIHEDLEPILKPTYGSLIYQEQCMEIAVKFAKFDLLEADHLRKAIGKKLPEEMVKIKTKFVDGCLKNGYTKEVAEEVFSWIEKFGDYGFNKSHAVAYAIDAYYTAYLKTHHPLDYYMSLLKYSEYTQKPQEEIDNIINDAKLSGICVIPPLLKLGNVDFTVDGDRIAFGLKHIKGIGDSAIEKIKILSGSKTYNEFILSVLNNSVGKNIVTGLINSGATRYFNETRTQQRLLYDLVQELSDKEIKCFIETLSGNLTLNIIDIIKDQVFKVATKRRKEVVCEIISNYERAAKSDTLKNVLAFEKLLLGATLSGSEVDLYGNADVRNSCLECCGMRPKSKVTIGVIIEAVKGVKTKKGKNPGQLMAFLTVSDGSYKMDNVVVFPNSYEKYMGLIFEGSPVLINGVISDDGNSLIANDLGQL